MNRALQPGRTDDIAEQNFVPAFHAGEPGKGRERMVRKYIDILRSSASKQSSIPLVQYIENVDEEIKLSAVLLLLSATLLILNKILPSSIRKKIEDWTRSGGDEWMDMADSTAGTRMVEEGAQMVTGEARRAFN